VRRFLGLVITINHSNCSLCLSVCVCVCVCVCVFYLRGLSAAVLWVLDFGCGERGKFGNFRSCSQQLEI
jgi:hypothetical protein